MPRGIEGELTDAKVIFKGKSIHNGYMGYNNRGEGGWSRDFVLFFKVHFFRVHWNVIFLYLEGSIKKSIQEGQLQYNFVLNSE